MKRDLNCPHICPSSQNALNLLHFPRRFDIIRKHGKLVWLSRQSDSLVMNRSAVRIRPPAPQKPARLSGFPCSLWAYSNLLLTLSVACSTPLADQMRRLRYSVALALLTNPPTSSTQPQGINSSTPQGFVGCLRFYPSRKSKIFARGARFRLRLCLRVAKIRTLAPLLVPLRCAETVTLLSDFCSAIWAARAAFFYADERVSLFSVGVFLPF